MVRQWLADEGMHTDLLKPIVLFPFPGAFADFDFIRQRYYWNGAEKTTANFTTFNLNGSTLDNKGLTPSTTVDITVSVATLGMNANAAGAFACSYINTAGPPATGYPFHFDNATNNFRVAFQIAVTTAAPSLVCTDSVLQANVVPNAGQASTGVLNVRHGFAGSWALNNFLAACNGIAGPADTAGTLPSTAPTVLRLGKGQVANSVITGSIARVIFWNAAKAQPELNALSTLMRDGVDVPTLWTPYALGPALKAWWSADDHGTSNMTDDGAGAISSWKDRISGVTVTGATTARPTWSATSYNSAYAGVTFNGTTNALATTAFTALPTGATAGNIAIMVSQNSSAGPLFFLFGYGQEGIHSRNVGGYPTGGIGHLNIGDSNTQLDDTSASFIGNHLAVGEWSGTTMRGWLDGSATNPASVSTISINTATTGGCRIGSRMESATFFFTGAVRHVFVTTLLTTLQRQQLEGWLAWGSGLQSLLPAGHPYKSMRP